MDRPEAQTLLPPAAASPPARALGGAARDRFLTPAMSALLDFLRVGSALVVVFGHGRQLGFNQWGPPVSQLLAHYAVIVFFVISGLSIGTAASKPGASLAGYALDRAVRILPVAAAAIALGSLAFALRHGHGPAAFDGPELSLTPATVLYPLFFLTESPHGQLPLWNPAYWSLSYEVWYYALFGAAVFLRGPRRLVVVSLLMVIAGPQILLLMPIWLMGVALAGWARWRRVGPRGALACLGMAAVLLAIVAHHGLAMLDWLAARSPIALVNAQNTPADLLLGLAIMLILAAARALLPFGAVLPRLVQALRAGAGMTFTTYLFHFPLLCLAMSFGLRNLTDPLAVCGGFAALLMVCWALAVLIERRTPGWRSQLAEAWGAAPRALARS